MLSFGTEILLINFMENKPNTKHKNSYKVINPFSNETVDEVQIHSTKEIDNILNRSFNYK